MIKSAILEEQKAQLKKEELAARILNQSRNELYLKLRYLDLALGNLALAPGHGVASRNRWRSAVLFPGWTAVTL